MLLENDVEVEGVSCKSYTDWTVSREKILLSRRVSSNNDRRITEHANPIIRGLIKYTLTARYRVVRINLGPGKVYSF